MRLRLKSNWRHVLKWAWSVRLMGASGFFSLMEEADPFLQSIGLPIPAGAFALIAAILLVAAFIARFIQQENLKD